MIYQKHGKDCMQASLSNLLGIQYEEIPEFFKIYPDMDKATTDQNQQFTNEFDEWLEKRGFFRINFDAKTDQTGRILLPYISCGNVRCLGMLQKKTRPYSHCVVIDITRTLDGYEVRVEDPLKGSDYSIDDLVLLEFIISKKGAK